MIIFASTKNQCESLADLLSKNLQKRLGAPAEDVQQERDHVAEDLKSQGDDLARKEAEFVKQAVAFHHGSLSNGVRHIIETGYRSGTIMVLVATTTLAAGINLPAATVIIRSIWRTPNKHLWDVLQLRQMMGRAGRKGLSKSGESIIIAQPRERQRVFNLLDTPQPYVRSVYRTSLFPSLARLALEGIASGLVTDQARMEELKQSTLLWSQAPEEDGESFPGRSTITREFEAAVSFLKVTDLVFDAPLDGGNSTLKATETGKAIVMATFTPEQGLLALKELRYNVDGRISLPPPDDDADEFIQLFYLITPFDNSAIWPNWNGLQKRAEHLSEQGIQVFDNLALDGGVLNKFCMEPPQKYQFMTNDVIRLLATEYPDPFEPQPKLPEERKALKALKSKLALFRARRLWTSMALVDFSLRSFSATYVCKKYGIEPNDFTKLRTSANIFANQLHSLAKAVCGSSQVAFLLQKLLQKLEGNVKPVEMPLLKAFGVRNPVNIKLVKAFVSAGLKKIEEVAAADDTTLHAALSTSGFLGWKLKGKSRQDIDKYIAGLKDFATRKAHSNEGRGTTSKPSRTRAAAESESESGDSDSSSDEESDDEEDDETIIDGDGAAEDPEEEDVGPSDDEQDGEEEEAGRVSRVSLRSLIDKDLIVEGSPAQALGSGREMSKDEVAKLIKSSGTGWLKWQSRAASWNDTQGFSFSLKLRSVRNLKSPSTRNPLLRRWLPLLLPSGAISDFAEHLDGDYDDNSNTIAMKDYFLVPRGVAVATSPESFFFVTLDVVPPDLPPRDGLQNTRENVCRLGIPLVESLPGSYSTGPRVPIDPLGLILDFALDFSRIREHRVAWLNQQKKKRSVRKDEIYCDALRTCRVFHQSGLNAFRSAVGVKAERSAWTFVKKILESNQSSVKIAKHMHAQSCYLRVHGVNVTGNLEDPKIAEGMLEAAGFVDTKNRPKLTFKASRTERSCIAAVEVLQRMVDLEQHLAKRDLLTSFRSIEMPLVPLLVELSTTGFRIDTLTMKNWNVDTQKMKEDLDTFAKIQSHDEDLRCSERNKWKTLLFDELEAGRLQDGLSVTHDLSTETLREIVEVLDRRTKLTDDQTRLRFLLQTLIMYRGVAKVPETFTSYSCMTWEHPRLQCDRIRVPFCSTKGLPETGRIHCQVLQCVAKELRFHRLARPSIHEECKRGWEGEEGVELMATSRFSADQVTFGQLGHILDVDIGQPIGPSAGEDQLTVVDMWRKEGWKYSDDQAADIRQVQVTMGKKTFHYPADQVFRVGVDSVEWPSALNSGGLRGRPWDHEIRRSPRDLFLAQDGFVLLAVDYCQMELRMLAHQSNDIALREAFSDSAEDIFLNLAKTLYKKNSVEEVTPELRAKTKTICYGIIYGSGKQTVADKLKTSLAEASDLVNSFRRRYPVSGAMGWLRMT